MKLGDLMNSLGDSSVKTCDVSSVKTDNDTEFGVRIRHIMNILSHDGDVSEFHRYDIEAARIMLKDYEV